MALSDDLRKLGDRANEAEGRAAEARRRPGPTSRPTAKPPGRPAKRRPRRCARRRRTPRATSRSGGTTCSGAGTRRCSPRGHRQQEGGARSAQGTATGRQGRGRCQVRDRFRLLGDRRGGVRGSGRDPGEERGRGAVGPGGCKRLTWQLGAVTAARRASNPERPRPSGISTPIPESEREPRPVTNARRMDHYSDEERLSRREAAERLTDIAYGLTSGGPIELRIDGRSVKLPSVTTSCSARASDEGRTRLNSS